MSAPAAKTANQPLRPGYSVTRGQYAEFLLVTARRPPTQGLRLLGLEPLEDIHAGLGALADEVDALRERVRELERSRHR